MIGCSLVGACYVMVDDEDVQMEGVLCGGCVNQRLGFEQCHCQ